MNQLCSNFLIILSILVFNMELRHFSTINKNENLIDFANFFQSHYNLKNANNKQFKNETSDKKELTIRKPYGNLNSLTADSLNQYLEDNEKGN